MGLKEKSKYEDSYEFSNHEGQQYVSFKIAEETYMVDIRKVREFITYDRISIIPNLPEHYKGCLLYTSPSPRDKRQSRMPSSA